MSGEFTVVNSFLVTDLKALGLWNQEMLDQIKYYDGNLQMIANVPQALKDKYKEAFEIDPETGIAMTAVRGKWIDQSQSHNVFMMGASGKKLNDIYFKAWNMGLKTTYYLRTLAATQIEKSTLDAKKYGYTQKREYEQISSQQTVQQEKIVQEITPAPQAVTPQVTPPIPEAIPQKVTEHNSQQPTQSAQQELNNSNSSSETVENSDTHSTTFIPASQVKKMESIMEPDCEVC